MTQIEKTGRNVDEALELALIEMGLSRDEVEVEVLEEESKGVFGLFGQKDAKIRVTQKENAHVIAKNYVETIMNGLEMDATVDVTMDDNLVNTTISGDGMAIVIGKHGNTLDAIQYLTSLVVNKNRDEFIHVSIDSENYREKRKESLVDLAHRMAHKAKKQRKDIILHPMNSYERRIVHTALQSDSEVNTRSEGKDPYRKVIIFLNR